MSFGFSTVSAENELLIQALRTLASVPPPCTLSPMILMIARLSVGRPALIQFVQVASALKALLSTDVWGDRAASSAAKRGASAAPKMSRIAVALFSYQPRLARPE